MEPLPWVGVYGEVPDWQPGRPALLLGRSVVGPRVAQVERLAGSHAYVSSALKKQALGPVRDVGSGFGNGTATAWSVTIL